MLLGRDAERRLVVELLRTGDRLVTVTGRGGIGKTALARAVLDELSAGDATPVVTAALESLNGPEELTDALVRALGLTASSEPTIGTIADHLAGTATVLLLDNFEHVVAAARDVSALLRQCPDLRIVVTSQVPLRISGEQLVPLDPLAVPEAGADLDAVAASPAVALYLARAAAGDPWFTADQRTMGFIGELVRQLDGLPLAIELAAARCNVLPARELVARSPERRLDLLSSTASDTPRRQLDLRAALHWTLDLLTESERLLFRRLSVVTGAFTLEVAEALALDPERAVDEMSTLVDVRLVDPIRTSDGALFVMPPTVRLHAAELLAAAGQAEATTSAHVLATAAWCEAQFDGPPEPGRAGRFLPGHRPYEDLLQCLRTAVRLGAVEPALQLLHALAVVWEAEGFHIERARLAAEVLALADGAGRHDRTYVMVRADVALLSLHHQITDDPQRELASLEETETLARASGDEEAVLHVLSCRTLAAPHAGFPEWGFAAAAEGEALARRIGAGRYVTSFQLWRGMLAHQTGSMDEACASGVAALQRARQTGDVRNVLLATLLLRPLLPAFPELAGAVPTGEEALALARSAGESVLAALLLHFAAHDALDRGDLAAAALRSHEALVHARTAPPAFGSFALVASSSLFAAWHDHERVAWIGGAMTTALPAVEAMMPRALLLRYRTGHERARHALGGEAYEAAAARGRLMALPMAARSCEAAIRERLGAESGPPAGAPARSNGRADGGHREVPGSALTPRQREVLRLLATGLTNREIGVRLGLSAKTVMHHLAAIYLSLGVRGRTEATAWAFRAGLVANPALPSLAVDRRA